MYASTVRRAVWLALVGLVAGLLKLPAAPVLRPVPLAAAQAQEHRLYLPMFRSAKPIHLFLPGLAAPMAQDLSQHAGPLSTPQQSGFVQRVGENLQLDGQPYTFIGTNISYLFGPYFPEANAEGIVSFLASKGVQVIRVFVEPSCDLQRVARLVDLAGKYNVRLILTLQNFFGHEDGWWFKGQYDSVDLPHIRNIVPLFANRPEVLMWELMNEPTCPVKDANQTCWDALYHWAQVTSQEIKRLDPNHLVSSGMHHAGFDDSARTTYRRVHALDTIDILTVHGDAGKIPQEELDIAHELGKPIFLGEVYMFAYDKQCNVLPGGALERRAQVIADDLARDRQAGLDGYLLWQYNPEDGCGVTDYRPSDPAWDVIKAATRE